MENLKSELKQLGWNLSNDGIAICEKECNSSKSINSKGYCQEIINCALNFDLSEIGEKVLPDDLGKGKLNEFRGPCVLQVMKIRNASAPKVNEESSVAPRLLQLHLSDGHKTCIAIEHSSFGKEISINTPPGSKVCLKDVIKFGSGFGKGLLLLDSKNIRFLGGQVESLYNKWKSAKDAGGFFRNAVKGDDAPPPFVPFGKKIDYHCDTSNPSLQRSNSKGDVNNDNKGFSEQRESAIAKVKESMGDASGKSFTTSRKSESESSSYRKFDDRPNTRNYNDTRKFDDRPNTRNYNDTRSFNDTNSRNDSYKKPGHVRVDESKCDQICQMGFTRSDAFGSLRRHNNNLDEALESLLSSKQQTDSGTRNDSRGTRGNFRGRGGGRRSNRGGRSNHNDQDNSHQTPILSLFDFVETKMTNSSQNSKSQTKKSNEKSQVKEEPSCSSSGAQQSNQLDDDALQEEYIMEYVKELSLVETHGESHDRYQHNEESRTHETNPENSGVNRYRSSGNRYSKNNSYRNESNFDNRNDSRKFQSNRARQDRSGSERFSQADESRRDDRNSNRHREEQTGSDRFSNSRGPRYNDRRRRNEQSNDSSEQYRSNDVDYNRNSFNRRAPNFNNYSNNRSNRSDSESGRRSPQKSYEQRQNELPPRLRKARENREFREPYTDESPDPKRGLTLGDTNPQSPQEQGGSAAAMDKIYPVYSSEQPQEKTKTSPSHSYQDQRQQNRGEVGRKQQYFGDHRSGNRSEQFDDEETRWKLGMSCQAIYWEDGQFYKAVVTDIHPTEPTAVVRFIGYENCEEVLFSDMRPDKSLIKSPLSDHGAYNGPTAGLEFRRGHKGPTRYPREREKRGPQRPTRTLYQPPTPEN